MSSPSSLSIRRPPRHARTHACEVQDLQGGKGKVFFLLFLTGWGNPSLLFFLCGLNNRKVKHLIEFCCLIRFFVILTKKTYSGGSHTSTLTHYYQKKEKKKDFILMEERKYFILIKINKKGIFCECLEFKVVCIS